jgi:hypothetical protein
MWARVLGTATFGFAAAVAALWLQRPDPPLAVPGTVARVAAAPAPHPPPIVSRRPDQDSAPIALLPGVIEFRPAQPGVAPTAIRVAPVASSEQTRAPGPRPGTEMRDGLVTVRRIDPGDMPKGNAATRPGALPGTSSYEVDGLRTQIRSE